jgi:hypothetical protein
MRRKTLFLFLIACSSVWGKNQVATLDLTHATVRLRLFEPVTGSASGGSVGSGVTLSQPMQPIQMKLTDLKSTQNGDGHGLFYEIELKNVSDATVRIPWDPSPRDIEPSPPRPYQYQLASLRLVLTMPSGESERLEAATIYGSETSRTLRTLRPGEWVRIRAATKVKTLNRDFAGGNKIPMVRATWEEYRATVDGSPSKFHETLSPEGTQIQSQNTMPLPNEVSQDR